MPKKQNIVRRGEIDYPVEFSDEFTLSDADFAAVTDIGKSPKNIPKHLPPDLRFRWQRLIIQYVERSTLRRPDYKALKAELISLAKAARDSQAQFARACKRLAAPPRGVDEFELVSRAVVPHEVEALDLIARELCRQLGDCWQAAIEDGPLDLSRIESFLYRSIEDLVADHGHRGRIRDPDLEWFIDHAADLHALAGGHVAANGRDMGALRDGPFVRVVEAALEIAARCAAHVKIKGQMPKVGNLGQLVFEVITKRNRVSK